MRAIVPRDHLAVLPQTILLLMALIFLGCARHADFVDLRDDLRTAAKAQEQDRKKQEELQSRLKSLEAKLESKPAAKTASSETTAKEIEGLRRRLTQLEDRVKELGGWLARLSEARPPEPTPSETVPGESSRQSKPAKLSPIPPLPETGPMIPGTPAITPTSAFNLAYNDYIDGRYALAVEGFQRFLQDFPATSKTADAHYFLGESYYSTKDLGHAAEAFERVAADFPKSEKVPPALFKLGVISTETGDVLKARGFLKRVVEEFPASPEAKLAKSKLAELR
jgi:tol-pal system protein YbgF